MKTYFKIFSAISFLTASVLLFESCKKNSNSNSSNNNTAAANMSANGAIADNAYDDAFGVALQAGSDNNLDLLTKKPDVANGILGNYYCANVTISGRSFPITLTVDFGSGCTSADSITRSGSITYVFSGKLSTPGTTITATFTNYTVNGYTLDGTYAIANTTTNLASPQLTTTVTNGNIHFPTDTSYSFSGTKTISLASGSITDVSSLIFNITGNYKISSSYGDSLSASVTTPLEKKLSCRYIDDGIISFIYTKGSASVNGTLDFGNGTCDDSAIITIGSFTKTITLK